MNETVKELLNTIDHTTVSMDTHAIVAELRNMYDAMENASTPNDRKFWANEIEQCAYYMELVGIFNFDTYDAIVNTLELD